MEKRKIRLLIGVLAVVLIGGIAAFAGVNYGSEADPLITKSYLDEVVKPQAEAEVEAAISGVSVTQPGEFTELTAAAGEILRISAGGEVLLRSGSAKAGKPLTDTTAGSTLSAGGSLTANHMYLAGEDCTVTAGSGGAVLMVCGSYSKE